MDELPHVSCVGVSFLKTLLIPMIWSETLKMLSGETIVVTICIIDHSVQHDGHYTMMVEEL